MNTRIAVDRYTGPVWYDSFADIVADFTSGEHVRTDIYGGSYNRLQFYIGNIVLYNVCYRDFLREHGIDALIERLCYEASAFRKETEAIRVLRNKVETWGALADYDIQCLSVDDSFLIKGDGFQHGFCSLRDMRISVEKYHRRKRYDFEAKEYVEISGIHILCDYEPYPVFDSNDSCDDRDYNNYFFLRSPFSADDIARIDAMPTCGNNCKVSEHLTHVSEMPLLYYKGDGPSMLLVQSKR